MRYTVVCPPLAENDLAFFWIRARDQDALTHASDHIDNILRHNPFLGTKHGDFFALTIGPLTVTYDISPDDLLVAIRHYSYHG